MQEYSREYEVVFRMLENDAIKLLKFRSNWDYDTHLQDNSGAPGARVSRSNNIQCLDQIVQFDKLSHSYTPESGIVI